ncbi:MAG: prolipoprotein diacylglyceryl transferase [Campylobacterota bacterium]
MDFWQNIYTHFDPVAFSLGSFSVHWYGIMYVTALLVALIAAKWYAQKDNFPISKDELDTYFIYVEIGVIVGARVGYIFIYSNDLPYYLNYPWQMFNPFIGGQFSGISGMSYHGAIIGFLLGTWLFTLRHKFSFNKLMDLVALSVPVGYTFGRIGNFLNQELIGRETSLSIGVYVNDTLRHPSQLYEALLEGVVIAVILYFYRYKQKVDGELIALYAFLYGVMRIVAEFFRMPDIQIGYLCCGATMGQLLSISMVVAGIGYFLYLRKDLLGIKR